MTRLTLGLVLLSALFHATWNTATKGSEQPAAFLLAMEVAVVIIFAPVLLLFDWSQIPTATWWALAGSIVAHTLYADWLARSYAHGDLSLVYPIARSTPALVPFVAIPVLGESISPLGAAGISLVLVGMWAVHTDGRARWSEFRSLGVVFAYLTLLATVAYSVVDKQAMAALETTPWTGPVPRALVYMALLEFGYVPFFAMLALRRIGTAPVRAVLTRRAGLVVGGALCGVVSYGLILEALRTAPVSYVVAVRQTSVLFAVVLGVLVLGERPGPVRVLGALVNVAGVALIATSS